MNTGSFSPILFEEENQIGEVTINGNEPVTLASNESIEPKWRSSILSGYEATMRGRAAACEAGR